MSEVVVIECPPGSPAPTLRAAGMSVLERHVRDARRDGARVFVRGDDAQVAHLGERGVVIERLAAGDALPDGARVIAGDQLAGVTITDGKSRRRAEWALLQTCRRPYDGPGDRFVIRSISLRITRLLAPTRVTPTQVTLLNAAVGLVACIAVALSGRGALGLAGRGWLAIGGAAFVLSVILDSADGELARIKHMTSRLGMIIDNASDDVIDNGFVLALGIALGGPWLIATAVAAGGRWLQAVNIYVEVARAGKAGDVMAFRWWFERDAGATETFADFSSPLTWLRSLGRRDSYCLVFGGLCLAGLPRIAASFGVVMCGGYAAMLLLHLTLRRGRG